MYVMFHHLAMVNLHGKNKCGVSACSEKGISNFRGACNGEDG